MRGTIPLLHACVSEPFLPVVGAADATGYVSDLGCAGVGVGFSMPGAHDVQKVGLQNRSIGREGLVAHEVPMLGKRT